MKHLRLLLLTAALISPANAEPAQDLLDPQRIAWSEVQLEASKLFMSADAVLRPSLVPTGNISETLMTPGEGNAVQPGRETMELAAITNGFSRHTEVSLLLNPVSGAAIQRVSTDSGNKNRFRIYRFTDAGAYHRTRWPRKGEEKKPPEEWSEQTEGLRPYPTNQASENVTESTGLIYVAAASDLNQPGDQMKILTYARSHLYRVSLVVAEPVRITVDYQETKAGKTVGRKSKLSPLRILIRGEPAENGDEKDEFEMLGLKGDIELLLEPETRLPLQLNGNVKIVGRVSFRLRKAVLN
jgi:hypothetical protein